MPIVNLFAEWFYRLGYFLLSISLTACVSFQTPTEKYDHQCAALFLDVEITQCYNGATSLMLARRIEAATYRLADGDWPHLFQMLIQLRVGKTGQFEVDSVLRSSNSQVLDKKILRALGGVNKLFVPQNDLFDSAGYARLKLLIKPGITPLLGDEQLVDDGALVVYVHKVRI